MKSSYLAAGLSCALGFGVQAQAQDYTRRSFLQPRGELRLAGDPVRQKIAGVGLTENNALEPLAIAPHLYWGVSDSVTLGITHERGLCLKGCPNLYHDSGFAVLIGLFRSPSIELDAELGVPVEFEPFRLALRAGALASFRFSRAALVFAPRFVAGLNQADTALGLPLWCFFQASRRVVPFVGVGLWGPVRGFAKHFAAPVEAGLLVSLSRAVDLGALLSFYNLLGRDSSLREREAGLLARFGFE